jgi:drug/metabolite transporter (DMT)-like permease
MNGDQPTPSGRRPTSGGWRLRVVVETCAGLLLLLAGIVMLVTPGPGVLAMLAGLVLLARHVRWVRRLTSKARERLASALDDRRGRGPDERDDDA